MNKHVCHFQSVFQTFHLDFRCKWDLLFLLYTCLHETRHTCFLCYLLIILLACLPARLLACTLLLSACTHICLRGLAINSTYLHFFSACYKSLYFSTFLLDLPFTNFFGVKFHMICFILAVAFARTALLSL